MNSNDFLLKLIKENKSINEISSIMGLSNKQIFYRLNMLKIKGYDFIKKYYYNGNLIYNLKKNINQEKENEITILTNKKDRFIKIIAISDLHLGNFKERIDILYKLYDFCIINDIHLIINTGDLVEGSYANKKMTIEEQIEHLIKDYPFDKNILNFIVLGNHDESCLLKKGINISKVLEHRRHDLISLGFGSGEINIKNDKIIINHPSTIGCLSVNETKSNKLLLSGHTHKYQTRITD